MSQDKRRDRGADRRVRKVPLWGMCLQHACSIVTTVELGPVCAGIDIIADGEMSKIGFSNYVMQRYNGFANRTQFIATDLGNFPEIITKLVHRERSRQAPDRQAGAMVAKVLAGTAPANLPVDRPIRFLLVINLKTARSASRALRARIRTPTGKTERFDMRSYRARLLSG